MKKEKQVIIYTDGSALGNPGPGGYGVVLCFGPHQRELTGGYRLTTNNRMELLAAIKGLEALTEPCRVTLYSDSRYVVDGITKGWARRWRANNWMRNKRERALNVDLWAELLELCEKHEVAFRWVKGHAGNAGNERCDQLAQGTAQLALLPVDENYAGGTPR
ncbi:MAG TPA: ribonuclease HI [Thermoflexia bacterium]|nr:ribonuclease HI [Thermoflexia bacterium]